MERKGEGKVLDQFNNPDNPRAHFTSTGPEIWQQTQGRITHFVSSMGTTGTITGVGSYLKTQSDTVKLSVYNRKKKSNSGYSSLVSSLFTRYFSKRVG